MPLPILALYGGSFDPVHNAHLGVVRSVIDILKPQEFRVLPCHLPPHKEALQASQIDRVNMLQVAMEDLPNVVIDPRELQRETLSYTYDTVVEIRREKGLESCLCFVIGWDSWITFTTWYRWQDILKYTNLVVVRRPGISIGVKPDHAKLLAYCSGNEVNADVVAQYASGKIVMLETDELDLASSGIRLRVAENKQIDDAVPKQVARYIKNKHLYAVKSTEK